MFCAITPELIAGITALAAVVISPLVSIYIVRKEVNSKVLSENRQNWINELRVRIATLLTLAKTYPLMGVVDSTAEESRKERTKALHQCANEIALYINPNEPDHAELIALIRDVERKSASYPAADVNYDQIVSLAQNVLKREWRRVKSGK